MLNAALTATSVGTVSGVVSRVSLALTLPSLGALPGRGQPSSAKLCPQPGHRQGCGHVKRAEVGDRPPFPERIASVTPSSSNVNVTPSLVGAGSGVIDTTRKADEADASSRHASLRRRPGEERLDLPQSRAERMFWLLEEVGQPYDLVHVDIRAQARTTDPRFAEASPLGKVPALAAHPAAAYLQSAARV